MSSLTKFSFLFSAVLFFSTCATDKIIAPESAEFNFYFYPPDDGGEFITLFETDTLFWHFNKAYACIGEIGIHWSWYTTTHGLAKTAHDIPGGKVSPKIYDYFAIDLLKTQKIQTLQVEPKFYDHVHMIFRSTDLDTIIGIENAGELREHSLYFEGTVNYQGTVFPFRAVFDSTYSENDLGDIVFELQVLKDGRYDLMASAKLSTWFNDIIWSDLTVTNGDTIVINNDNANKRAASKIENRFTMDNTFEFEVKNK